MKKILVASLAALLAGAVCLGVETITLSDSTAKEFSEGERESVVVDERGRLLLALEEKELFSGVDHAWCAAVSTDGTAYVGTVPDGKVYAVKGDSSSVLFETGEAGVFSIAVLADGAVAAGTGSEGRIFRISADGKGEVLTDLEEPYVFALAVDSDGRLLAATGGGSGRIYGIDDKGASSLVYDSPSQHLLALALGGDKAIYTASGDKGAIYKVKDGGSSVLFTAPQGVVQALAVGDDGAVYAGTAAIAEAKEGAEAAAVRSIIAELQARQAEPPVAPTPPTPPAKREYKVTNAVYQIRPSGEVRQVFEIQGGLVLSLLARDSGLVAATAGKAGIYSIALAESGDSLIYETESQNVQCLAAHPGGGFVAGLGMPGAAVLVGPGRSRKGTFTSRALKVDVLSRWGRIDWDASVPVGTKVALSARSGNSPKPDATWSDWTSADGQGEATLDLPPARYLQYRVEMAAASPESTPSVKRVSIAALPMNLAPEVTEITAARKKAASAGSENRSGRSSGGSNPSAPPELSGSVTISWKAKDANGDTLEFALSFRNEGFERFLPLEEELDKPQYDWDTTTVPDGNYFFRVTASDAPANPETSALEGSKTEGPFIIDNTGPVLSSPVVTRDGGRVTVEFEAADAASPLKEAFWSVDGGQWQSVFPVDDMFDSARERIRIILDKGEAAVVMIRVADRAENVSATQALLNEE